MQLITTKVKKRKLLNKVKLTTAGSINGTWHIYIKNINDADIHDVEVAVLAVFGRKKKKLRT
jgi:hypothetical protein